MYEILIAITIMIFVSGLLLFNVDKELKLLNELEIKTVKLITVSKLVFLFFWKKQKDLVVTQFTLINTIFYYIINLSAVTLLVLHFILNTYLLYMISCVIFFLNLVIISAIIVKISLNNDQREIKRKAQKIRNAK